MQFAKEEKESILLSRCDAKNHSNDKQQDISKSSLS